MNLNRITFTSLIAAFVVLLAACGQQTAPQAPLAQNDGSVGKQSGNTYVVSDQASCEALAGTWSSSYCTFYSNSPYKDLVVAQGDVWEIQVNVAFGSVVNNGTFKITNGALFTANGITNNNVMTVDCGGSIDPYNGGFTGNPLQDLCPPDTSISGKPSNPSNSSSASFSFGGTDNLTPAANLSFECKLDSGSFAACTSPKNYTGLADGPHTFQVRAKDAAGNVDATPASYTWTIASDTTAPTAAPTQTPAANGNGWNKTDVTVTWNWTDNSGGSGIDPANCTTSSTSSGEGSAVVVSATCKDKTGNTGSASVTLKIDKTKPTVVAAATASPNANGWYTSNVTVRFTCTDSLSGVVACPADQTLSSEGSAVSSTAQTVTDQAGNTSDPSNVVTVKIDRTPPTIALVSKLPAPNGAGWNNSNVTVTWSCTDGGSGVVSSSVNQVVSSEGNNLSSTGTCTDNAGNTASNTQTGIKIDKTPPALSPSVSPNPVLRNLPATATPNASDGLSGIATQSCPAVSTSSLGLQSVTCTATDRAGNTTTAPASYTVVSSSQALSSLRSQVQGLSGLGFVNRTLLLATLSQAQVFLSNGVRSGAVSSLNTFIGQVDGIRGISGGLTNAQANSLIAQANLIIQSINAGG